MCRKYIFIQEKLHCPIFLLKIMHHYKYELFIVLLSIPDYLPSYSFT